MTSGNNDKKNEKIEMSKAIKNAWLIGMISFQEAYQLKKIMGLI